MLKNLGLQTKIFFLVSSVVVVSFAILTMIVSNKTFEMAKKNAFSLAQETADKYKNEIKAELQGARITSETLATVFATLKGHGLTDRTMMNDILRNTLAKKEYITAFCIAYEPDALDGRDKQFAGKKPEYDETGRYAPYWNKLGGNIAVEPLYDIDIADWYIVPKTKLHEYITDPYPYEVQGHPVMLASLIFPIVYKEKFIGIVSSDIVLDKLQEMISKVDPYDQDGYTEIFSNAGSIVAHPDKTLLGKDLLEGLAYEMLTSNPSSLSSAIRRADEYLAEKRVTDGGDTAGIEKYENGKRFADALKEYATTSGKPRPDLSLLNPELAGELLRADPARLRSAEEAKAAVRNGETYISAGRDYYTVYIPIQFSSVTTPWSVAVSIPMTTILDNAAGIRNYVILASAVAVCVIAFLLYIIAKSVTRPILELSNTAKVLGEGNFDAQVPLIKSNDEIGALSVTFRFMAEKINSLIREMQNYAKALEEKNVYLNRLNELKDEFLANTSHELRTPLNGIIGIVESMIDGATGQLSREQKYNLAVVVNSGKRLSNMINDILDFTRLKNKEITLQIKAVELKTLVDTVIVLLKPLTKGKDLALVNGIDDSLPAVDADENRIQQILHNLIGNALKFTEKGTVRVSAALVNGMAAVTVSDTGIGIPEDKFEAIFESFEQVDGSTAREYGGTGLGLSITKKIVELHGGTISVASRPAEGSEFTFTVPLSEGKSAAVAAPAPATLIDAEDFAPDDRDESEACEAPGYGEYRILVVDDEPVNIQVLSNLLSIRNYQVTKAYNGADALALITGGEQFDLVLLDVMMPKMSGYDVCARLREMYSLHDLPVLMLTAKNRIQDVVMGLRAGANDYLPKPFDKEELLARVKTLLELKSAVTASMAATKVKNVFLANMSHEIRTPLNAVIGLTRLLLKTSLDDRQRDYTAKMGDAASNLLAIVNDILDFSKVEAGKMALERTPFNVRRVLDDVAAGFQERSAAAGVAFILDADPSIPPVVLGDPLRLRQIFINLVDNAFKFTEKGSVTVRAAVSGRGGRDVALDFAVEDTGIGMNPEQAEKIFSAFSQADSSFTRKYGGTGLGLTIAREMAELMGGKIAVAGEEGKGSVFSFSCVFPLPEEEEKTPAQGAEEAAGAESAGSSEETADAERAGRKMPGAGADEGAGAESAEDENAVLRGMRVLLVEDNEINLMIADELLSSVDIEVTTAENGAEALKRLEETPRNGDRPPFDVVLMDLQMPVMDGYEATRRILTDGRYPDMPIFAMTAHAYPEERERALGMGMKGHLAKPIDVDVLYRTLREVAARAGSVAPKSRLDDYIKKSAKTLDTTTLIFETLL
ncbi:MAG: response regulator [Desulfovibrio sp.]|jgi:signal transduction histidine kinase|nr:response regulator [Desulfovibrio sp.]